MQKKKWMGATALIAICMIGAPLGKTFADSLSGEKQLMAQLQQEAVATDQSIQVLHAKAQSLKAQVQSEQQSMAAIQTALSENQAQTAAEERQLHSLDRHIAQTETQIRQTKASLSVQLRTMYENGKQSYLSVLFASTSWSDFLSRMDMLMLIAKADHHLEDQFVRLQSGLSTQRHEAFSAYQGLLEKHTEYTNLQQADNAVAQQEQQALNQINQNVAATTARHGMLESQIQLTQAQIQKIQQETQQAQQLESNASYVNQQRANLASASAAAIIQYAETFMGTPYVWGGTSPSGFDCSGFTQYVFAHFGVSIYRTSEEQFAEGVPVATNDLQPGDLVFFSTYAPGATHVGIYIGNNMMVDAQDYGVSIDNIFNSYWGPKYLGARQFLK
ncbi:MAG: NlpC/P60 family protein [Firmicutes bacterium]|nr:NlpC/P60 family protein [Bacillota bacterium]